MTTVFLASNINGSDNRFLLILLFLSFFIYHNIALINITAILLFAKLFSLLVLKHLSYKDRSNLPQNNEKSPKEHAFFVVQYF